MEGWKFWWGIAAFFLGGLATQLNGWLAYRRQRKDKAADAADAAEQRRAEFELEHLMATNQKLHDYREKFLDFTNAAAEADSSDGRDSAARRHALEVANEALNACELGLNGNVGFILDDTVRASVRQATKTIEDAATRAIGGQAVDYLAVNRAVSDASDALSARVRALYARQAER
ncbi:hypothetical protein SRB17_05540 [Streptomyces sp. RB17]|uniref:hypothetical protein n=1 Tax=Streptomyces sp. RB17 TaxID=2585197 RepID=UPI001295A39B|nr:hypothetical protein [Streptomyces sp. RB17]MQY32600.1 hypothetical protein [Streptomyces sp. RB17]